MSATQSMPQLFASGQALEQIDWLKDSSALLDDIPSLRQRMSEEGYLFLRELLNRDDVLAARGEVCNRLASLGLLDPNAPLMDCVAAAGRSAAYMPEALVKDNTPLLRVLYDGPMINLFERLLGEPVKHYDFTWFRSVAPGRGTQPL